MFQILHEVWTFFCKNFSDDSKGCSYGQLVIGSFITTICPLMYYGSCRVFWWNIKSPRALSPTTAQIWHAGLLAFPKTKITFERDEISNHWWDSGKYNRTADGDWDNCVRSQGAYFEGDWGIIVLSKMFLVLVSTSINTSVFHITWLDTFCTMETQGSLFSTSSLHLLPLVFLIMIILMFVRWNLIVVLICISVLTSDAKHLFMFLMAIHICYLEKCLIRSVVHFYLDSMLFVIEFSEFFIFFQY